MKESVKTKDKGIANNPRCDHPLSKEAARLKYDAAAGENDAEPPESLESLVEGRIQKAMMDGVFDNLPGKGKPINLQDYLAMPEHLRLGYQVLKNSGYLPEEVRLKKEMETIKERIHRCASDEEKKKLMKELTEASQQYHLYMEYNRKIKNSIL